MAVAMTLDVLIVGAGPVGLTLAAECQRYGIDFRIIDQAETPSQFSKALVIWSNTTEHLAAIGLADRFLEKGRSIKRVIIADDGQPVGEMQIDQALDSPYPSPFILPQSETERLLIEHLESVDVQVERITRCVDVRPSAELVDVEIERDGGCREILRAKWVAGCDGARSLVRKKLSVEFEGVTEKFGFILADAKVAGELSPDSILLSSGSGGTAILFPVEDEVWRVFALREGSDDRSDPTLEEVQLKLNSVGLSRIRLSEPLWLSHFVVNERVASRNRVDRVFLLGDAAHIHSPAGGQGMNTGMQDAFNLGWKLRLLCSGAQSANAIAESYFEERHPVARKVVRETSAILHFGIQRNALFRVLRRVAFPVLSRIKPFRRIVAERLSELRIKYASGYLILEDSRFIRKPSDLSPGCLARDVPVLDSQGPVSLWQQLLAPMHSLVLFSGPSPDEAFFRQPVPSPLPDGFQIVSIWNGPNLPDHPPAGVLLDPDGSAHRRYGLNVPGWYLVRPDQYIAGRGTTSEFHLLSRYVERIR